MAPKGRIRRRQRLPPACCVAEDVRYPRPPRGTLGEARGLDKWINVTLLLDRELRSKMRTWVSPAWQLNVTSSLLMATVHLPATTRQRREWMIGMVDLRVWVVGCDDGTLLPESRQMSGEASGMVSVVASH